MPEAETVPLIPLDTKLTMEGELYDKDPILFAARKSNISELTELINSNPGSAWQIYAPNNVTLLHRIAEGGYYNCVEAARLVLDNWQGIDVNVADVTGKTALHYSVISQQPKLVELLLAKGASPFIKDKNGANALHRAVRGNTHFDIEIVGHILQASGSRELLRSLCKDETVVHIAAKYSAPKMLQDLLNRLDGDLSILVDSTVDSPLHLAASQEDTDNAVNCVEILLDILPKDLINKTGNTDGNTALHVAAMNCRQNIIQALVRNQKTDLFQTNNNKETSLHVLAKVSCLYPNSIQCAETLIFQSRALQGNEAQKRKFIVQKSGILGSAILIAVKSKAVKVAQFLIKEHGTARAILVNEPELLRDIYERLPEAAIPMLDKTITYIPSTTGRDLDKINVNFGPVTGYDLKGVYEETNYISGLFKASIAGQRKVLEHPVVRIYIEKKWTNLEVLTAVYTSLYFLWLIVYSILSYEIFPAECPLSDLENPNPESNITSANYTTLRIFRSLFFKKAIRTHTCEFNVAAAQVLALIIYLYAICFFVQEGIKIVVSKYDFASYYRNIINYLQLTRHVLVMINASAAFMKPENIPAFQYHLGSIFFAYAWMMSLYELTNIPSFALLFSVIIVTVKKYAKLLVCFVPILVGLVPCLSRYVGKDRQYDYLPFGIIKNFILMTGEIEYKETFYDENGPDLRSSAIVGQFFILFAVFGIGLVLANVLTGVAVKKYEDLIKDAEYRTALMQLNCIHFVDSLIVWLYNFSDKLDFTKYYVTCDGLPTVDGIQTDNFSEELMQAVQNIAIQAPAKKSPFPGAK